MTISSSSKKHGQDQPELSGPTPKSQRTKMGKSDDNDKKVTIVSIRIRIKPATSFSKSPKYRFPTNPTPLGLRKDYTLFPSLIQIRNFDLQLLYSTLKGS